MENISWASELGFAALPVALLAWNRFNVPSWSRTYTSAAQYRGALAAHVILYVLVLVLVCAVLKRNFGGVGTIWFGLGITLLLCMVGPVGRAPRMWLHRLACIPSKAHSLGKELALAKFTIAKSLQEEVRSILNERGLEKSNDWSELQVPMQRLMQATALFVELGRWETSSHFKHFFREADNDFYALRRRFDQLSIKTPRMFATIDRIGEMLLVVRTSGGTVDMRIWDDLDGISRKVVGDLITDACKDIADFYDEACLLAARGALSTQSTGKSREKLLRGLGFEYVYVKKPTAYGILAKAAALLYIGIWIIFLALPDQIALENGDISIGAKVSMITVIVTGAFAVTVFAKRHWGFATSGLANRTPIGFLVGAGICAALFSVLVNLATGAILIGGWSGAILRLTNGLPYLHASTATAVVVAWLVQDHRWRGTVSERLRRLRDAAVLGSAWFLSSIVSSFLIYLIRHEHPTLHAVVWMPVAGLVFGYVLGYSVPESIRLTYPHVTTRPAEGVFVTAGSHI
ncbi:hypothetical protein HDG32_007282 [Paraburkholderia sp. CI2]|uniref:hypothetical protein n=1 Tax=Paraburkholderia sp. CI2 TaxID=2723093 RepID=UPI0016093F33|nr:hypothetical protein [Paraburkholderia sp. CI2]MBB5471126.1 hypothetical protein [Paraburkholderia sp. CI2]